MSDTPETDKVAMPVIGFYSCATVTADFARKLERERDDARKLAESAMFEADRLRGRLARLEQEKDEARAQYQTTHLLAEALAKTQVELKAERDNWREAALAAVKDRDHNKREWDKCAAQLAAVLVEAAE